MGYFPRWIVLAVEWIHSAGFPEFVGEYVWSWPIFEILHLTGLCLLIGTVGVLDLRLLGIAKGVKVVDIQRLIPWGVCGFAISLTTGMFFVLGNQFSTDEYLGNIAFVWKMGFILLAGINVVVFYISGLARLVDALGPGDDAPIGAKIIAATSLCLWIGVIFFGRFLATFGAF